MPVDLAFTLSALLSDALGEEVEVTGYSYDPVEGVLCVEARVAGSAARGCAPVRACKGLEGARLERCLAKTLARSEELLRRLADSLRGG